MGALVDGLLYLVQGRGHRDIRDLQYKIRVEKGRECGQCLFRVLGTLFVEDGGGGVDALAYGVERAADNFVERLQVLVVVVA